MHAEFRKQRILMVLESVFPSEGGGGAESQVKTLARHFRAQGHDVSIVVPMTPEGSQEEQDTVAGIPVWRIPYPRIRILGGLMLSLRLAGYLLLRQGQYDVIHAHIAHNMAATCALIGRLLGKTVVIKFTGWMELEDGVLSARRRSAFSWIRRVALRRAQHIQATSQAIRSRLLEFAFRPDRVHVIPNAVDLQRFSAPRPKGDRPFTGIYAGRLVPVKGVELLVDAWIEAFQADEPVRLLLVGEGDLRNALQARIDEAGRSAQVILVGGSSAVETEFNRADVGLLVSYHEGLSNTLLEYMAAGLPVLATRISGSEDFVSPGENGWLVPSGDRAALVEALRHVYGLPPSERWRMGEAARMRVRSDAAIDVIGDRLEALYQGTYHDDAARRARST